MICTAHVAIGMKQSAPKWCRRAPHEYTTRRETTTHTKYHVRITAARVIFYRELSTVNVKFLG